MTVWCGHLLWVSCAVVHDNLRSMWQGSFDQSMGTQFVTRHLMNRSEFWTPTPLPSISVSDPVSDTLDACNLDCSACMTLFCLCLLVALKRYNTLKNANSWSGRPMGLTFQRSIRALERHGHHTESVMVGQKLTDAILSFDGCATNSSHCHFTLEVSVHCRLMVPGHH